MGCVSSDDSDNWFSESVCPVEEDGADALLSSRRLTFSSATAKACTLSKRCPASLAMAFITTCSTAGGIDGTMARRNGGGSEMCFMAMSKDEWPLNGGVPHNHS